MHRTFARHLLLGNGVALAVELQTASRVVLLSLRICIYFAQLDRRVVHGRLQALLLYKLMNISFVLPIDLF